MIMFRSVFVTATLVASAISVVQAAPTSVNMYGSFQSELGCASDYQPDCANTALVYNSNSDVWRRTLTVPAQYPVDQPYKYKVALNGNFNVNYGLHATKDGLDIPLPVPTERAITFYYDDKTHYVTDNVTTPIVVAYGDFQSELGCTSDFQSDCLRSWLQDIDGDGVFTFSTKGLAPFTYRTKAAIGESFDENYGVGGERNGLDINFTVNSELDNVLFRYVASTHVLTVQVGPLIDPPGDPSTVPEPGSLALIGLGLAALAAARKRKQV